MKQADFEVYFNDYNARNYERVGLHYADDVIFDGPAGQYIGRDAVFAFFREMHAVRSDKITIVNFIGADNTACAAIEIVIEFELKKDDPDFFLGAGKAGDKMKGNFVAVYDFADDGKIKTTRLYTK